MEVSIEVANENNVNIELTPTAPVVVEVVPQPRVDITIDRGVTGPQGPQGDPGTPGVGIPVGGSTGQVLAKTSSADYATGWTTGGTVTSVDVSGDATGLTFTGGPITSSGTITLGGTLVVASGGTGVATSNGANSVMLRDANANTSINALFSGYSNVTATGTVTTLTVASPYSWIVTGSGGQTYQLPNATTLPVGALYTFNNNQSSGTIVVRNNSATTVITVQSGSEATLTLLSNANAAGSWDSHYSTPSNASWSTNTLNWTGSYTNGTWNGNAVDILRGGTGASTASNALANLGAQKAITSGTAAPTGGVSGDIYLQYT